MSSKPKASSSIKRKSDLTTDNFYQQHQSGYDNPRTDNSETQNPVRIEFREQTQQSLDEINLSLVKSPKIKTENTFVSRKNQMIKTPKVIHKSLLLSDLEKYQTINKSKERNRSNKPMENTFYHEVSAHKDWKSDLLKNLFGNNVQYETHDKANQVKPPINLLSPKIHFTKKIVPLSPIQKGLVSPLHKRNQSLNLNKRQPKEKKVIVQAKQIETTPNLTPVNNTPSFSTSTHNDSLHLKKIPQEFNLPLLERNNKFLKQKLLAKKLNTENDFERVFKYKYPKRDLTENGEDFLISLEHIKKDSNEVFDLSSSLLNGNKNSTKNQSNQQESYLDSLGIKTSNYFGLNSLADQSKINIMNSKKSGEENEKSFLEDDVIIPIMPVSRSGVRIKETELRKNEEASNKLNIQHTGMIKKDSRESKNFQRKKKARHTSLLDEFEDAPNEGLSPKLSNMLEHNSRKGNFSLNGSLILYNRRNLERKSVEFSPSKETEVNDLTFHENEFVDKKISLNFKVRRILREKKSINI